MVTSGKYSPDAWKFVRRKAYENAHISSHWMRSQGRFRSVRSWKSSQASPKATSRRVTVPLAIPVMRQVARIELPSTSALTTAARSVVLSLFILTYYA